MSFRASSLLACLLFAPCAALALGPHEVLVLVNRDSRGSVSVADEFVRLRNVPGINVVALDIPRRLIEPSPQASPADFARFIWTPATNAVAQRGIGDHILAWVYSTDFPLRITTDPAMSVQGLTFTRNHALADTNLVTLGRFSSPLFCGPDNPSVRPYPSQTFDSFSAWLGDDMPLPSMMLGYAGERGNSAETILRCLKDGAASDSSAPTGTVYFIAGEDIRAKARAWQFAGASQELSAAGISSAIVNEPPRGAGAILGIMAGNAAVEPALYGRYVQGSFADHLTSAAGVFDGADQTKLSAWLDAGVTASAGTVVEPYALWTKFPSARVFAHYTAGCTMIESLYLSTRCPLQIIFVGEPLACPWGPRAEMTVEGLAGLVTNTITVTVTVKSPPGCTFTRFMFLVDGKTAPDGTSGSGTFTLDPSGLTDGTHLLRVVAYRAGALRSQVFAEKSFVVCREADDMRGLLSSPSPK